MAAERGSSGSELAELLVQLGRAAYAGAGGELTAAQWAALRYFARANRFSRTVSGFADYHATTRGTASQTVRSLVERGYLVRSRSERDGRSVVLDLTRRARRTLGADPLQRLALAAGRLDAGRRQRLAEDLRALQDRLGQSRGGSCGVCARCGHLLRAGREFRCGLMDEALDATETGEICLRYRPRPDD